MPVFNGEAYLVEAVESVIRQTLRDWELIAVDDGSQDGSRAILEDIARTDPRVRLVVNEHRLGISAALNRGWRAARAPYIARLDADDVALRDRLVRQIEFLDAHPSVAVVGGAAIIINGTGRRISTIRYPTASRRIRSILLRHNCLAHPSVTIRRVALEEVGGYRFDHVEDYDLWLRLSERFDLANLAEPVILYRQHPRQVSLLALEDLARRRLAVRAAAQARRHSRKDPLDGVDELTPATIDRLGIDATELARVVEHESVAWATILAELGHVEAADELVARAATTLGDRAARAYDAATNLRQAEKLLSDRRPAAAVARLLVALRREPRYAFSRLTARLSDLRP
jgi:hypothetical protein